MKLYTSITFGTVAIYADVENFTCPTTWHQVRQISDRLLRLSAETKPSTFNEWEDSDEPCDLEDEHSLCDDEFFDE
jgi:hypothetical protein